MHEPDLLLAALVASELCPPLGRRNDPFHKAIAIMRRWLLRLGTLVVFAMIIATAVVAVLLYERGLLVRSGDRFADSAGATPNSWQAASPSAPASPWAATASPLPHCPLSYSGFCEFVALVHDLIVAGDFERILERTEQGICPDHDEVVDPGCRPGEPYVRFGVLQGEGLLLSVARLRSVWAEQAEPPRQIRGLCDTPTVWACSRGPAILIRTSDDDWDWIFSTRQETGEWIISSITIQRREYEDLQIPPEVIVAWPPP